MLDGDHRLDDGVVSLGPVRNEDRADIEVGIHDPDVVRWIGPPPGSIDDVLELNRQRAAAGSPTYSIRDQHDAFLGLVWLNRAARDPTEGSVGYFLLPRARGHGYATRGVRLLVDHAVRDLEVRRIILVTDAANAASRRVADRAGFVIAEARPRGSGPDGQRADMAVYVMPPAVG